MQKLKTVIWKVTAVLFVTVILFSNSNDAFAAENDILSVSQYENYLKQESIEDYNKFMALNDNQKYHIGGSNE